MFTLPDWHLQNIGLPVAIVGLLLEVISWVIQRRLAGKGAPNVNPKLVGKVVYSVVAALVFGGGFALISSGNFCYRIRFKSSWSGTTYRYYSSCCRFEKLRK